MILTRRPGCCNPGVILLGLGFLATLFAVIKKAVEVFG